MRGCGRHASECWEDWSVPGPVGCWITEGVAGWAPLLLGWDGWLIGIGLLLTMTRPQRQRPIFSSPSHHTNLHIVFACPSYHIFRFTKYLFYQTIRVSRANHDETIFSLNKINISRYLYTPMQILVFACTCNILGTFAFFSHHITYNYY